MAQVPTTGDIQMFDDANSIHQTVVQKSGNLTLPETFDDILQEVRNNSNIIIDDFHPAFRPSSDDLIDVKESHHFRGFPVESLSCGTFYGYNDGTYDNLGISYTSLYSARIDLGTNTGQVELKVLAGNVPDKFILEFDGVEVINTGYLGDIALHQGDLNAVLDPDEPIIQETGEASFFFQKTTATRYAYLKIFAPLSNTGWYFNVGCPVVLNPDKFITYDFVNLFLGKQNTVSCTIEGINRGETDEIAINIGTDGTLINATYSVGSLDLINADIGAVSLVLQVFDGTDQSDPQIGTMQFDTRSTEGLLNVSFALLDANITSGNAFVQLTLTDQFF